jgi:hypothetical protein
VLHEARTEANNGGQRRRKQQQQKVKRRNKSAAQLSMPCGDHCCTDLQTLIEHPLSNLPIEPQIMANCLNLFISEIKGK